MPTARGALIALLGLGVWVAGRIFGAQALEQLGFGLIALLFIALAALHLGSHELHVSHVVNPERVQAGKEATVAITLENSGKGDAPLVLLEDKLPSELPGRARFAFSGLESGGSRSTSFRVRPARRGRYLVGPLELSFTDPFGLARTRRRVAEAVPVLAYPATEKLSLPRDSGQRRSSASSARRQPTGQRGDEFYTLRDYVEGDDLRRIHWPSTAKRARYMVRQEETPWHARATIVLDDTCAPYVGKAFDRSVEATASLVDLYHRSGYTFRLTGVIEPGLPDGRSSDHLHRCLDLLATLDCSEPTVRDEALIGRLGELQRSAAAEGTLVIVGGGLTAEQAGAVSVCVRHFRAVTFISFPPSHFALQPGGKSDETALLLQRAGVTTLTLGPHDPLAPAWGLVGKSGSGGGEEPSEPKEELV